jgi:hypothetical protein
MSDLKDWREMELWCLQRARAEPENAWKWQGQAERWRNLAHTRIAAEFQKPRQMTAGPMAMGPNPITGERQQQQS